MPDISTLFPPSDHYVDAAGVLKVSSGVYRVADLTWNVGALGAGATFHSEWVDLAAILPAGRITAAIARKTDLASAGESFSIQASEDGINSQSSTPSLAPGTNGAFNSTSSAIMMVQGRIFDRFLRVRHANGSTPQTALSIKMSLFTGL